MEKSEKWLQTSRVLDIYRRLAKGEAIHKATEATFCVNEKTIQRDIDDIRDFLAEVQTEGETYELIYARDKKGYILIRQSDKPLISSDVLAIAKVLLESRAFCRQELETLINKLMQQLLPEEIKKVQAIISNEQFHYMPVQHGKSLLDTIWCLSQVVKEQRLVKLEYKKENDFTYF